MSEPAVVIVLRIASLFAFVGPMLVWPRGPSGHAHDNAGVQLPVLANFASVGLFFVLLLAFSGTLAGPRALGLAVSGTILAIAGGVLVLRSRAELGAAWSLAAKAHQSTGLITTGPYRFVRHPIYSGFALIATGQALAFDSMPALAVALIGIVPTFAWRAYAEEALLSRTFDERYNRYRTQTKMFIPFLF